MKSIITTIFILVVSFFSISFSFTTALAERQKVIFEVGWYDVGKAALAGQPGIVKVEKGWDKGREINTVVFDTDKTDIDVMEKTLQQSGTYISTIEK